MGKGHRPRFDQLSPSSTVRRMREEDPAVRDQVRLKLSSRDPASETMEMQGSGLQVNV
jgi:hypothetical protein